MNRNGILPSSSLPWSSLPVVVVGLAAISGGFAVLGIGFAALFGTATPSGLFSHVAGIVLHEDIGHYRGNMFIFLPFGALLTILTSNRHVLGVILVAHIPASIFYGVLGGGIIGSSVAAYGLTAATLVRAIGLGMQNASMDWLQVVLVGILTPFSVALFLVALLSGPSGIAHFGHFFGFLLGAGYEAIFVLSGRTGTETL